ncbi:MAG: NYN domain-containing protein [Lachnospiraceae bacterium]|nr:NYN domain-containing protein [Lachnospiraceae bacterium]
MEREEKYALLIDADNISPKYIEIIVRETEMYGIASIRRIYGDWTDKSKGSWKECLLDQSLSPIQQYSYTTGKNSSDSAMIIDAMDILYTGEVDGFIIATSDSDFTRLAMRLREAGKRVIGMGESKTPSSFIKACAQFKTLDVLYNAELKTTLSKETKKRNTPEKPEMENGRKTTRKTAGKRNGTAAAGKGIGVKEVANKDVDNKEADNKEIENKEMTNHDTREEETIQPITSLESIKKAVLSFVEEKSDDDGWLYLGDLGNMIGKRYPDFDSRNYGYSKFGKMIQSFKELERKSERSSNGISTLVYVRLK